MADRGPLRLTRRALLGAGGSALLLAAAGCGAVQQTPPATSGTPEAPVGQASPSATALPTGATSTAGGASPASPFTATRLVKHAMGETRVPATPRRVVVLDTGELDSALALGVTPVGATTVFQDGEYQAYLKPWTGTIAKVGTIEQPNLETIASLRPDLILSSKLRHEKIYDKLAQIAPTVFTASVGVAWKENLVVHAEALGKSAEAETLMTAYRGRLEEFKAKLGTRREQTQVSILRSFPDHVRLYMKQSFIGTILMDAGLPRPAAQNQDKFADRVNTKESIPAMDGDVIFIMHFSPDKGSLLKDWMNDPLWRNLKAVKTGRVYEVPDDTWALGIGILAANRVLDDLFTNLAGQPGASATPAAASRVVKHAMGETRVPATPRRVVVLDTGELDSALALGVTPVGSVTGREGSGFPDYLGDKVAGIKSVGSYEQPNLETIAALRPDLILSSKLRHAKIYDKLTQIAPTVFTETVGVTWKENLPVHAEALGRVEEGRRLLEDYETRAANFKRQLGDRAAATQVSVVRALPDHIRVMMKATFAGTVLRDAGLPRPPAQDKEVFMERVVTKEGIPLMDGDVMFVMYFVPEQSPPGTSTLLQGWLDDPLWRNLKAVQSGRVYEVADDVWARGIGIIGANKVLDDLVRFVATS